MGKSFDETNKEVREMFEVKPTTENWEELFDHEFTFIGRHSNTRFLKGSVDGLKDFIRNLLQNP